MRCERLSSVEHPLEWSTDRTHACKSERWDRRSHDRIHCQSLMVLVVKTMVELEFYQHLS